MEDGTFGMLYYRGANEEERIESAVHYKFLQDVASQLANAGLLTNPRAETLLACQDFFVEVKPLPPEPAPAQPAAVQGVTDLTEGNPVQPRARGTRRPSL